MGWIIIKEGNDTEPMIQQKRHDAAII